MALLLRVRVCVCVCVCVRDWLQKGQRAVLLDQAPLQCLVLCLELSKCSANGDAIVIVCSYLHT